MPVSLQIILPYLPSQTIVVIVVVVVVVVVKISLPYAKLRRTGYTSANTNTIGWT